MLWSIKKIKMMKKIILSIGICISTIFTISAQESNEATMKETQEWLKEKIEMYPNTVGYGEGTIHRVEFPKECQMRIVIAPGNLNFIKGFTIPLNEIYPINIEQKSTTTWITFRIIDGYSKIELVRAPYSNLNDRDVKYVAEMTLILNKNSEVDNIPERIKKALTHAKKLCGGKVINEKF